jgi:uncharacterized protein (TIGR04255 family)
MSSKKNKTLPEYDNPPLTEVVCGVTFKSLDNFIATHLGILWSLYQPDFPGVEEVAPLASPIEIIDGQQLETQMEFTDIPPLPRQMFISQDGGSIIQVQRDRFIFNWRKLDLADDYPRYENVFGAFENKLAKFEEFIKNIGMEVLPIQYELSYVNQIAEGALWKNIGDLSRIFPHLQSKIENGLILSEPETINSRISFLLPNKMGRLHITIRTGARRKFDSKKLVIFELTARGFNHKSMSEIRKWFDIAREWIVQGFTDLTAEKIQQEKWKRRK